MAGTSGSKLNDIYLAAWSKGLKTTYYLRTLGASRIESSTLDAARFGYTQKRDKQACGLNSDCFFSTAESLTANNLVVIFPYITNFECQQYLIRQAFEETIHSETFIYCCESLRLGQGEKNEIYNMRFDIPSIKEKDDFVIELTKSISSPNFRINNDNDVQSFLRDLIGYYVIMEGIFFYAGFAMMLALRRSNKMVGIGKQFWFIMRDESLHLAFGCGLINTITGAKPMEFGRGEYPQACPEGIVGINAQQFCEYVEYIADRRLERIEINFLETPPRLRKSVLFNTIQNHNKYVVKCAQDKTDLEKRINHLLDKSNPRHTNLTADLDTDFKDLQNIETSIGAEKLKTDAEIKKLTDEKTRLQTERDAKDALIKQKDEVIGQKLTADLISKLENLATKGLKTPKKNADGTDQKDSQGNIIYEDLIDTSKIQAIKTVVDELKTKGIGADFSKLDSKFNEVKEEVKKIPGGEKGTNY
ncbi:16361_t:CDS:2 [Cetraspora pellucida]|uniref:16361_t:CDS:1 n=1 Tax=Cetraspora pellucida TaxID=1433469 RepID=A0ACA9MQC5_9GLOM|nr:16361_t:CDS:2 [Cetraspora pellucida]